MQRKRSYLVYLIRVLLLFLLLAILLPKVTMVCRIWLSTLQDDQRPSGNPIQVEAPSWSEFVFQLLPGRNQKQ